MAGRKKRKFNWGELSSEDEEVDTKKSLKKEDKKAIEEQTNKLDRLSVRSTRSSKEETKSTENTSTQTTRSTRGSRKRGFDESDTETKTPDKSASSPVQEATPKEKAPTKTAKCKKESPQITKSTIKEENSIPEEIKSPPVKEAKKTIKQENFNREEIKPPPVKEAKTTIKQENSNQKDFKSTPTKETNSTTIKNKVEIKKVTNLDEQIPNALPDKTVSCSQGSDQCDFDLPVISVKAIKMKLIDQKETCKKFNKQHLSPSVSPTKAKFTQIKIELNNEQRDWIKRQVEKYDGEYDKEFDAESDMYFGVTNSRKRKY